MTIISSSTIYKLVKNGERAKKINNGTGRPVD